MYSRSHRGLPHASVVEDESRADDDVGAVLCVALQEVFPQTENEDVAKSRWRKIRLFLSAVLAEPALNVFLGCDLVGVEVLARALIAGHPSSVWLELTDCVQRVIFVWQFLVLVRGLLDESPVVAQAEGELILFALGTTRKALLKWEVSAQEDAKAYRAQWQITCPEQYKQWLQSVGVADAATSVVGDVASMERLTEQANEERTWQVWPARKAVRPCMDDTTAAKEQRCAERRRSGKTEPHKAEPCWDDDDCRHEFPPSVLRAPGVITFMCGCGYIIGFELLRETESPAHVVSCLVQRFVRLPRVIYFDTACQAQRNALRRVPWLLHEAITAWFIDRFHRCNHKCSPVFDADQYPEMSRGHDTAGAERQHSIKKRSKNSLSYMTQRRFIVRSRYIAAHNNIRVSQRRHAGLFAVQGGARGSSTLTKEIQHCPVETYFHRFIVARCERVSCPCRVGTVEGPAPGLQVKV